MDITATLMDAASKLQAPTQTPLDGLSLRPLLNGEALEREAINFHYPHFAFHKANRPASAIRAGPFKLIYFYDDSSIELFDLSMDPGENNNLSLVQPETAESLKSQLKAWLSSSNAGLPKRLASDSQ